MRLIYSYIKFLKKVLKLDMSSYWVKKELMKPKYQSILDSCKSGSFTNFSNGSRLDADKDDRALVNILLQPEFKNLLDDKIDFQMSSRFECIVLKADYAAQHHR